MSIYILYFLYLWVTLIHCIFVGATMYFFFGKRLYKNKFWLNAFLFALCLAFLESYWIPLVEPLQLYIFTKDAVIQNKFEINEKTNIASILRPQYFHIVLWLIQGFAVEWFARKQFKKISTKS